MAVAVLDEHYFALCALITVGMQLSFFAVAASFKFDKVTDFAGGMNFTVLAIVTLVLGGFYYPRQLIATAIVVISRTELAIILLCRVLKRGKDARFDAMRNRCLAFFGFWVFQMVWVFGVSAPAIFVNSEALDTPLVWSDYAGTAVAAIGFLLQVWADVVKMRFRNNAANNGKFCAAGPWAWSRHPNYFGEILLWWGVFILGTPVFSQVPAGYATVVSPLLTMVLLLGVSGMPEAEQSAIKRYNSPAYARYVATTSPLISMPPCLYGALPMLLRRVCLFEFPCYGAPLATSLTSQSRGAATVDEEAAAAHA